MVSPCINCTKLNSSGRWHGRCLTCASRSKRRYGNNKSLQPARIFACAHPTLCEANMFTIKQKSVKFMGALSVLAASIFSFSGMAQAIAFDSGIPAAWTCTGNCGTLGADGNVTTSPEGGNYGWISTTGTPNLASNGLNVGGTGTE